MSDKTIAAIATPLGSGGIGVIRISGPDAYPILNRVFVLKEIRHNGKSAPGTFLSRRVYHGHIIDPATGHIIDEVLAFFMRGPKSFTREDVVEIQSHSGFVVLDRILSLVVDLGASVAAPGEFTKRAFLNGRIDLTQAEAVIELINAPCGTAVQMAGQQISGKLRELLKKISDEINRLRAKCEASIEFSEVGQDPTVYMDIQETMQAFILPEVTALIQRQKDTSIFQDGLLLTIAGAPNVGKSSLLNRLAEREAAIVSDIPGTTRDILREYLSINGVPIILCDTAGLQETSDPVEIMGIQKARDHIQRADIILLVLEATRPPNTLEEKLIEASSTQKTIVVISKDDLADKLSVSKIKNKIKDGCYVHVSAKLGTGIAELKNLIIQDILLEKADISSEWVAPNLRQRKILEQSELEIHHCLNAAETQAPLELVSESLNRVRVTLDEISGNCNNEALYDQIFSQFCIGK
ncbi:tRNA uridine-5-carboxymethylaminomethyl(34) synthesis GTPase MnmE [Desulfosarcina sp.]|uniref:tRNA uridine-5-carboxymethylaminomethyl(34) synthesis GTPase MnmE n=1 Tax=Desulfosarcina sp. TaxID=2027861 RepID=UPI003970F9CE